jgi:DtxR family Mn-dependent transcriptional regulator
MRKARVEDYLVAIDQLCEQDSTALARSGRIAKVLGIAHGTVSTSLLRLVVDGRIVLLPYEGAHLTDLGRICCRKLVRRRRIIELLLKKLLKCEHDFAVDEARLLETAASDRLIDSLDSILGFPEFDGVGRQIPRPVGTL